MRPTMHGTGSHGKKRRDGGANLGSYTEGGWHVAEDLVTSTHHEIVAAEEQVWPRSLAGPVAIARDSNTGALSGGADPFHPAIAAGS